MVFWDDCPLWKIKTYIGKADGVEAKVAHHAAIEKRLCRLKKNRKKIVIKSWS